MIQVYLTVREGVERIGKHSLGISYLRKNTSDFKGPVKT